MWPQPRISRREQGLVVYLSEEEVGPLATALAAISTVERRAVDFPRRHCFS
jgi:hypothetical protein